MEIDCSVPCPIYLKMLNSCPSKKISLFNSEWENLFELVMVALSISPYAISFLFLVGTTYYKTTRGVVIFVMIFAQNLIIEFLKGSLRDPRPNFKCNQQFGNPSNHATFYTSLMAWVIMEHLMLEKKFRFSNWMIKILLFVAYPFILYSRIYLNYHSQEQVINEIKNKFLQFFKKFSKNKFFENFLIFLLFLDY
jgi:membrane-associated phospholipid phosphatase